MKLIGFGLLVIGVLIGNWAAIVPAVHQYVHAEPILPSNSYSSIGADLFSNLAKKVVPSVVNISTLTRVKTSPFGGPAEMFGDLGPFFNRPHSGPSFNHPGFDEDAAPPPHAASLGTGFIIDSSGIILTNHHVVADADEIRITFTESHSEKPILGKVIGRDPELDVALIQVTTDRKLIPLALGDSDALEVGEYVGAVGNPFGQGHSFTHGIISAKGRSAPGIPLATYLQTDAPINPGNSGGPLVNLRGEVIGINNAIDARAQGIGFAIPINFVKAILPELKSKGEIARGYMGVIVGELSPEIASKINIAKNTEAPLVLQVEPGGPAYQAGLRPYDVITEFNGKRVQSPSELISEVSQFKYGQNVPVKVMRGSQQSELSIRLGKRPPRKG